jgi:hypothetical protein
MSRFYHACIIHKKRKMIVTEEAAWGKSLQAPLEEV